jgi:two-component system, chemotaxis family, sensor kinase Cph1
LPESFKLATPLDACAREPIHIPGSIQPHGMLFAVTQSDLLLAAVSENIAAALRSTPQQLIGGPISLILDMPSAKRLETPLHADVPADTVAVQLRHPAPPAEWDALVHRSGGLVLVELEPRSRAGDNEFLFARVRHGIERIRQRISGAEACVALARGIRVLSGYERVMIYCFDPYWNGEVVAEDKSHEARSYFGHSFPASDIPTQARALYTRNTLRLIPDARHTPYRIAPDTDPTIRAPIDLSGAVLRSVSPIHCEYLSNMGVVSSMSVSVIKHGAPWALVACHHSAPRFVSHEVRQGCELLTQAMARYLDTNERIFSARAIESVRAQETEVMAGARGKPNCRSILTRIAPALLHQAGAQGLALYQPGGSGTAGITPNAEQIGNVVEWLSAGSEPALFTDRLAEVCPAVLAGASPASGMAATRLPGGWLLWFRSEWPHTIRWAGDPTRPIAVSADTGRINPRKSFQTWREDVQAQSRPWDP